MRLLNHCTALSLLVCFTFFQSCKKDKNDPAVEEPSKTGSLKLSFENMFGTEALSFGKNYVNLNGDTVKISKLNYYISNIVVTKDDNSTFTESNSYHLVKHSASGTGIITLNEVPTGAYKSIKFMLGVDSARNVSGAQSGDLDPVVAADMFWTWSSGYVFFKLEGTSPKSADVNKALEYHIGGHGGVNKAQRSFDLSFNGTTANVSSSTTPHLHLKVDVNQVFTAPVALDLSVDYRVLSPGGRSKKIADNYSDLISFKSLDN